MLPLELTEINVYPIPERKPGVALAAFVRVVLNGQLVINSIRVLHGSRGLFISFPREFNRKEGKGYSYCFPINKALHEIMTEKILTEYLSRCNTDVTPQKDQAC